MKTITVAAYRRPAYTAAVINALADALLSTTEDPVFDRLIFSVDPGEPEVLKVCERASEILSGEGVIECILYDNAQRLGVAGNQYAALQRAFEEHGSDYNLTLEDDALVAPDTVPLVSWFYETQGGPLSDYTLLSLCNHREYGRGPNPGGIPDDPSYMVESTRITSPFAWCTTRWQWPFIKASWDSKVVLPMGWDYSLSYAMRLARRRALHPVLSRCRNIGRENGEHETPETFDLTQTSVKYSDGSFDGGYKIVARFPESELLKLDDWMLPERELDGRTT